MTNTLRPLTVGELLDRTFFLYRRHFLLFVGIAALPNLIVLSFQLFQLVFAQESLGGALMTMAWLIVTMIVYFVTIAISQGATITMPLAEQFFGRFGMLTDKYGMSWMLHYAAQQPPS